ncbi:MAG: hypothetical protein NVSMB9_14530 [Isosphaeraceae bacterium]
MHQFALARLRLACVPVALTSVSVLTGCSSEPDRKPSIELAREDADSETTLTVTKGKSRTARNLPKIVEGNIKQRRNRGE